jgi:hypothetical protein
MAWPTSAKNLLDGGEQKMLFACSFSLYPGIMYDGETGHYGHQLLLSRLSPPKTMPGISLFPSFLYALAPGVGVWGVVEATPYGGGGTRGARNGRNGLRDYAGNSAPL